MRASPILNRRDFLVSAASVLSVALGWRRWTRFSSPPATSLVQLREASVVVGDVRVLSLAALLPGGWRYEFSVNGTALDAGWTTEEGFAPAAKDAGGQPVPLIVDCTRSSIPFVPGANALRIHARPPEHTRDVADAAARDASMPDTHDAWFDAEIHIPGLLIYEESLPGTAWHEAGRPLRYRSSAPENMLLHLVVEYEDGRRRSLPLRESTAVDEVHEVSIADAVRVTALDVVAHGLYAPGPLFLILVTRMGEHRVLAGSRYEFFPERPHIGGPVAVGERPREGGGWTRV